MIGIIDCGMGNLGSVRKKLDRIGVQALIIETPDQLRKCDKIILPGVGHFTNAVNQLKHKGIWDTLNEEVLIRGKPILGICLGMQLMAKYSEEGNSQGFGWLDANVVRFNVSDNLRYKVPHIGWNTVLKTTGSQLFHKISEDASFYFIHSFHLISEDPAIIHGVTIYDNPFISVVQKGNIFGVQFHPEKSHDEGETLLKNFINC